MFVHTNDIKTVIVNIDSLISINGQRQIYQSFLTDINETSEISLNQELLEALTFLFRNYRHAIVSRYDNNSLQIIKNKLYNQIKPGLWYPGGGLINSHYIAGQLKEALVALQTKPCESVCFCGDTAGISNAVEMGLGTVAWFDQNQSRNSLFQVGPDFVAASLVDIQSIFLGNVWGFYSEVAATPNEFFSNKSKLHLDLFAPLDNEERPGEVIFTGGRYFSTRDSRFNKHALSLRIINSKQHVHRQRAYFVFILNSLISTAIYQTNLNADLITRIPPKPGQQDRLGELLLGIARKRTPPFPAGTIYPNLLTCVKNYASQKGLSSADRKENVKDAFTVTMDVTGKNVYLIDDVITTGATMNEAVTALYENGASKVQPVALAYHPFTTSEKNRRLPCEKCNGEMKLRCGPTGSLFYGCSNFQTQNCRHQMDFCTGVRLLNHAIEI